MAKKNNGYLQTARCQERSCRKVTSIKKGKVFAFQYRYATINERRHKFVCGNCYRKKVMNKHK